MINEVFVEVSSESFTIGEVVVYLKIGNTIQFPDLIPAPTKRIVLTPPFVLMRPVIKQVYMR